MTEPIKGQPMTRADVLARRADQMFDVGMLTNITQKPTVVRHVGPEPSVAP